MNKGLFAFLVSATLTTLVAVIGIGLGWGELFQSEETATGQATFTPQEVRKLIEDWPVAMAEVDQALQEYRALGGNRSGEAVIRLGVQTNVFSRQGWPEGRAEYLISYLYMLRNALMKNTEQHRALGYFMEHYERNEAVSAELKQWQIEQIAILLNQINEAPAVNAFPPGDVELMKRYFDSFHAMLVGYGGDPALAQR